MGRPSQYFVSSSGCTDAISLERMCILELSPFVLPHHPVICLERLECTSLPINICFWTWCPRMYLIPLE